MSYLDKLIAMGKSLLESMPKLEAKEVEVVKMDRYDRMDWDKVRRRSPALQQEMDELKDKHDYVDEFTQDVFALTYKGFPQLRDTDEMKPTHVANHTVISRIRDLPELKNLRQHTIADEYQSAMAMMAMQPVIKKALVEAKELTDQAAREQEEAAQQMGDDASNLESLLQQLAHQPQMPPGQSSGLEREIRAAMDQFNQSKKQFEQAKSKNQQASQQAAQAVAGQARQAAQQVDQKIQDENNLMSAFGYEDGDLQRMPFKERLELAKRIQNNRLAQFSKLLGQFKMIQQAESRKRVTNAATEIHGVTHSDELNRLTVGEYLNFADENLELLFWLRWTEQQLLTYDVRGKERQGQGPIICVVDESGSMTCEDVAGGSREAWSKALALSLYDQANSRKREFIYIGFASGNQQHVVRFKPGEKNINEVLTMTEHFFNGGTHYERPLMMALEIIEEEFDKSDKGRPDIVFITDDCYGQLSEDFMAQWHRIKDKTDIKCYGIALGCETSGALEAVADNVREVTELASDPRVMADVFRTI